METDSSRNHLNDTYGELVVYALLSPANSRRPDPGRVLVCHQASSWFRLEGLTWSHHHLRCMGSGSCSERTSQSQIEARCLCEASQMSHNLTIRRRRQLIRRQPTDRLHLNPTGRGRKGTSRATKGLMMSLPCHRRLLVHRQRRLRTTSTATRPMDTAMRRRRQAPMLSLRRATSRRKRNRRRKNRTSRRHKVKNRREMRQRRATNCKAMLSLRRKTRRRSRATRPSRATRKATRQHHWSHRHCQLHKAPSRAMNRVMNCRRSGRSHRIRSQVKMKSGHCRAKRTARYRPILDQLSPSLLLLLSYRRRARRELHTGWLSWSVSHHQQRLHSR